MTQIVPQVSKADGADHSGDGLCSQPLADQDPRICRTRAAVLQAARNLFDEGGWDAVTHVAVAERSGVGRSTLYRHWPEASLLLRDMITEDINVAPYSSTGILRTDLIGELEVLRNRMQDNNCERDMLTILERASVDPSFAELRARLTEVFSAGLLTTVREAIEDGRLRPGTDAVNARDQLVGPLMFRHLFARRPMTKSFATSLVDDFIASYGT